MDRARRSQWRSEARAPGYRLSRWGGRVASDIELEFEQPACRARQCVPSWLRLKYASDGFVEARSQVKRDGKSNAFRLGRSARKLACSILTVLPEKYFG